tara:strand:- start:63 stop:935 length:873 start_codon:yes stop_codon:yes gene_type:complete
MVKPGPKLEHLISEEISALAFKSAEDRIDVIQKDQWYNIPLYVDFLEMLDRLRLGGRSNVRPRCRRVIAASGMAKSYVLNHYRDLHPPKRARKSQTTYMPVILVEVPNEPSSTRLMHAILEKVQAMVPPLTGSKLHYQCLRLLKVLQPQLLIFDELQRIHHVHDQHARLVCEAIKWLSSELRVPTVVAGTAQMTRFFLSDDQLNSRFRPYDIPHWSNTEDLMCFVSTVLSYMPMAEPPDEQIFTFEGMGKLLATAGKSTDELIWYLKDLAIEKISMGEEKIRLEDIRPLL